MSSFKKLCEVLVETNGNPSVQQVIKCGYTIEHFIRLCDHNVNTEVLVQKAKEALAKMEV